MAWNLAPPRTVFLLRCALLAWAFLCTCGVWLLARRSMREEAGRPMSALWTTLFATCAFTVMIAAPALSCSYNLVMVLPGVLAMALSQTRLAEELKFGRLGSAFTGICVSLVLALLYLYRWGKSELPMAGLRFIAMFGSVSLMIMFRVWSKAESRTTLDVGRPNGEI